MRSNHVSICVLTICWLTCTFPAQATDCNGNGVDDLFDLQPTLDFGVGVLYATALSPRAFAIGDLDGDEFPDVVTTSTDPHLGVMLNRGDGSYGPPSEHGTTETATSVSLGDLDGDGDLDIVASSRNPSTTYFLRNYFGVYFQHYGTEIVYLSVDLRMIKLVDLDGDSVADLVSMYEDRVAVQLNDGTGMNFTSSDVEFLGASSVWLAVADVDNVNGPDLIVADGDDHQVRVMLGAGGGVFSPPIAYATGGVGPYGMSVVDYTGDGYADIAIANSSSADMSLLTNDGDGTFTFAETLPAGDTPFRVVAANFDGVNGLDLAVCNRYDEEALVYLNDGGGSFTLDSTQYAGRYGVAIEAADPDQDGDDDLMVLSLSTTMTVLENDGSGAFPPTPDRTPTGQYLYAVTAADFDNDLDDDLAVISRGENAVRVLQNDAGVLVVGDPIPTGADAFDIVQGDLNGDEYVDLAVANTNDGSVSVLINNATGDASFAASVVYPVNLGVFSLETADVDEDDDLDLLATYPGDEDPNSDGYLTGEVTLLLNDGGGAFTDTGTFPSGEGCGGITAADFNGDHLPDVAVANATSGDVTVHLNLGGGAFSGPTRYAAAGELYDVHADDLNGDNNVDLVAVRFDLSDIFFDSVWVFPGVGDGTFLSAVSLQHPGAFHITTADLDQDGDPEIIAPDFGMHSVSIFPGFGDLTFDFPVSWIAHDAPAAAVPFDLDGDGKREIAVCTLNDGTVTVLHNQFTPGFSADCNDNDIPDECDVASGSSFDVDQNGIPDECDPPGDLDDDGDVDLADLATLLATYSLCVGDPGYDPAGDVDGNGCVDLADLATLLSQYGFAT